MQTNIAVHDTNQKQQLAMSSNLSCGSSRKENRMNLITSLITVVAAAGLPLVFAAESSATTPAVKPGPTGNAADALTTRPSGAYAQVHLEFTPPAGKRVPELLSWTYRGALRDGVMLMDGYAAITQPGGELRLRDGRLTGRFERTHARGNQLHGYPFTIRSTYEVDAGVIENRIEGTAAIGKDAVFKVIGRIIPEAELRAANAVSPTAAWPYFLGPIGGGMAGQAAKTPTTAPSDFILRWRGEVIDIGEGIGSVNRYMRTYPSSLNIRSVSGNTSPILAGGKIYVSYFLPAPQFPPVPGVGPENFTRTLGDFIEQAAKHKNPMQLTPETAPRAVLEKHWIGADDVMLCLDAATGQTLWRTVLPARGWNLQHHKAGPYNMSPAVADGRVFSIGMGSDLHAFDATDGRHLWSRQLGGPSIDRARMDGQGIPNTHMSTTVIALPGVVVAPQGGSWRGFDPATGAERWKSALPAAHATLAVWRDGERHVLLGSNTGGISAIDAADGKELWRAGLGTAEGKVAMVFSAQKPLGPNGITVLGDQMLAYVVERNASNTKSKGESGISLLMSWRLGREGARPLWRVAIPTVNDGEHVPVVMHGRWAVVGGLDRIQVRDLGTGALVAEKEGPAPNNGGYLQAMGDLLLVRVDGTHGHSAFHFYRVAADGVITPLTAAAAFTPLGGGTSSRHHPIYYPLGDGRLFLRMADGIYCYDTRQLKP
jgi:outer membrane protein assembly factor BamB